MFGLMTDLGQRANEHKAIPVLDDIVNVVFGIMYLDGGVTAVTGRLRDNPERIWSVIRGVSCNWRN